MEFNGTPDSQNGLNGGQGFSFDGSMNQEPKFEVESVQLQFSLNNSLKKVIVQSNKMALILEQSVIRIDLENPSNTKRAEIDTGVDAIVDAWMHPNGHHLIIKTRNNFYYYLHYSYKSFKHLSKLKGKDFNHIYFIEDRQSETTGIFLLVTTDSIYLSMLKYHNPDTHANKRDDKYLSLLHKSTSKICGVYYSISESSIEVFCDGKVLSWPCFEITSNEILKCFNQQPNIVEVFNDKGLDIFYSNSDSYAFISSKTREIYSNDKEILLSRMETIPITDLTLEHFMLSHHHLILLNSYGDQLITINKLTKARKEISLKGILMPNDKIVGISADYPKQTYWLYSRNRIYELVILDESVSVWFNYFKMGKYEEALECIGNESTFKKNIVSIKQGYDYLQKGGFGVEFPDLENINRESLQLQIKGVKILANSTEPFEKICLMLLNLQGDSESAVSTNYLLTRLLIEYLLVKYEHAKLIEKNKIRLIILSSWLLDSMLRMMYGLKKELNALSSSNTKHNILEFFQNLEHLFNTFVEKNYKHFDTPTVYQIIKDMHFPEKLIRYAELIQDYQYIINYHINTENWSGALKILLKAYLHGDFKEVIYNSSSVLLLNSPRETTATWLKLPDLQYDKLLPSILSYNRNNKHIPYLENQSILFLQKVMYDKAHKSKSINNCYLSLLITYPIENDETKIQLERAIVRHINHLKTDGTRNGQYDPNFILRLCLSHQKYQAAILILISDMNLYEQALKLALNNNLTRLANLVLLEYESSGDYVSEPGNTLKERIKLDDTRFSMKKKLWLLFAKYLIDGVLNGKNFDILDKNLHYEKGRFEDSKRPRELKTNFLSDLSEIPKSIVNDDSVDKESTSDHDHFRLNKALQYLLSFSEINNLTLKDLLPLFPETININKFKDEIIDSLNQYNSKISQLTSEMNDSLDISRKLKDSIRQTEVKEEQGKVNTVIQPGDYCRICKELLVSKVFICFPICKHNYHKECLVKHYLKVNYKFKKVFDNFKRSSIGINREELENVLLKECILCNETNVNSIDDNIIDISDMNGYGEWKI